MTKSVRSRSGTSTPDKDVSKEQRAAELKKTGNDLFINKQYKEARETYAEALKLCPSPALFTNTAACYFRDGNFRRVLECCHQALELDKTWIRAYEHKANALLELRKFEDAGDVLEEGLRINPGDEKLKKLNSTLQSRKFAFEHNLQREVRSMSEFERRCSNFVATLPNKKSRSKLSPNEQRQLEEFMEVTWPLSQEAISKEQSNDVIGAVDLFTKAANRGCTTSMCALGRILIRGEGLPHPNPEKGVYWLEKCLRNGPCLLTRIASCPDPAYLDAKGLLGQALYQGLGVEKDPVRAETLLREGAEGKNSVVVNNLGCLLNDKGKHEEAISWFRQSAEAGYPRGMYNLAHSLLEGHGCRRDIEAAERWLVKASELGDSMASLKLAQLTSQDGTDDQIVDSFLKRGKSQQKACGGDASESLMAKFHLLFKRQDQMDDTMSLVELVASLESLGVSQETHSDHLKQSFMDGLNLRASKVKMLHLLHSVRPLTELETDAVRAAQSAAKVDSECAHSAAIFLEARGLLQEALKCYILGADHGDADCALCVGRLCASGPLQDMPLASKYLSRASKSDKTAAMADLIMTKLKASAENIEAAKVGTSASSPIDFINDIIKEGLAADDSVTAEQRAIVEEWLSYMHPSRECPQAAEGMNKLSPGMPWDHLKTMEKYVVRHRDSFAGHAALYSLRHFNAALFCAADGELEAAVAHTFAALMYDEKPVTKMISINNFGILEFDSFSDAIIKAAQHQLVRNPNDISAIVVCCWGLPADQDSKYIQRWRFYDKAVSIAEGSEMQSVYARLLPGLLHCRGCFAAFRSNFDDAISDFRRAVALLREVAATSLWPTHPEHLRAIMISTVEVDIARAALYLPSPNADLAISGLRKFIAEVPKDTHYYEDAHYELARAILREGALGGDSLFQEADLANLSERVNEAEQALNGASRSCRLPIFRAACNKSMIEGVNQEIAMMKMLASLARTKKRATGGNKVAISDTSTAIGAPCWACNGRFQKLQYCDRCKTARYCSRGCQKQHWAEHKKSCRERKSKS